MVDAGKEVLDLRLSFFLFFLGGGRFVLFLLIFKL